MNSQVLSGSRLALGALSMALCATAVSAQGPAPEDVSIVRIKGALQTRSTGSVDKGLLQASGTGAGIASFIGPFTFTDKATVDLATGLNTGGSFQLTAANGDTVQGSYVGRTEPGDVPTGTHFIGLLVITGGTGRYKGATGSLTWDRYFDDTNIPVFNLSYGSLTGTIRIPVSKP